MKHRIVYTTIIGTLLLASLLVAVETVGANTYVSLKGGFYISYPDDWAQVNYRLVDAYLLRNKASRATLDYDAVFAAKGTPDFFSGEYLILTVDTVGELKDWQIDSVLIELVRSFGRKVKYNTVADFLTNPEPNVPSYDTLTKTVVILNDVAELSQTFRKNLLMMKFYDRGVATFYFYSPDSLFKASKPLFELIAASLSTKDIDDALPKESLKVADLDSRRGSQQSKKIYLIIGAALVLIVLVVIRRLR